MTPINISMAESGGETMRIDRRDVLIGIITASLVASDGQAAQPRPKTLLLSDLEAKRGGRLGLALRDGASGRTVSWRADERFAYCSTFKLFLAAATFQRVQRGEEKLERRVPVRRTDLVEYSPVTEKAAGSTLSVEELLAAAVSLSDNTAANLLIQRYGGLNAWRLWYPSVGDRLTRVDRMEVELNRVGPGDTRDTTTPAQTLVNLQKVLGSSMLNQQHRRLLIRWLVDSPRGTARIKAAVPAAAIVAHKAGTGGQGGHTDDIGVVWPASGRAPIFVAAYYSESHLSELAAREAVLAEAVRRGLRALAG
jgi:beta-lactamase class A